MSQIRATFLVPFLWGFLPFLNPSAEPFSPTEAAKTGWNFRFVAYKKSDRLTIPLTIPWYFPFKDGGLHASRSAFHPSPAKKLTWFFQDEASKAKNILDYFQRKADSKRLVEWFKAVPNWWGNCDAAAVLAANFYFKGTGPFAVKVPDSSGGTKILLMTQSDISEVVMAAYAGSSFYLDVGSFYGKRNHKNGNRLKNFTNYSVSTDTQSVETYSRQRLEARDINAGFFHAALVNLINAQTPPMMDVDPGYRIFHAVPQSYRFEILDDHKNGSQREVLVELKMELANFHVWPTELQELTLQYWLELDKNGRITGGWWVSRVHPDFIWRLEADANRLLDGKLSPLREVLGTRRK